MNETGMNVFFCTFSILKRQASALIVVTTDVNSRVAHLTAVGQISAGKNLPGTMAVRMTDAARDPFRVGRLQNPQFEPRLPDSERCNRGDLAMSFARLGVRFLFRVSAGDISAYDAIEMSRFVHCRSATEFTEGTENE